MDELKTFLQNKKNLVTTAVLLVMLLVLPLGVYLAKVQQIFFSQAAGTLIQLAEEGSCITKNALGEKALKCGTVPLVLYNPFAPNTTHTALDEGVIAYFPFDETTGSNPIESMTGKIAKADNTSIVNGKLGKARKMEVNTVVTYKDSAAFDSDAQTVGAWVKPEQGAFKKDHFPSILARRTNNNLGMTLEFTGYDNRKEGQVQCMFTLKNAQGQFETMGAESSNKANAGSWNYIACSYNGSKVIVYVNGTATIGTQKTGRLAKFKDTERGFQQLIMGRNTFGGESLNGTIDEATIWNRALSDAELKLLQAGTKVNPRQPNLAQDLVSYWNFDGDTAAETAIDVKSGKNGAVTGASLVDYRGGKARKFDAQGQQIQVPDSFDFQKDTVTISAWVKPASAQSFGEALFPSIFNKRPAANNGMTFEQAGYPGKSTGQLQLQWNLTGLNNQPAGAAVVTTYDKIVPGTWNHVAAVFDGTEIKLYINGVISDFMVSPGKMAHPANSVIKIGRNIITNSSFVGDIDDVAYWGRGLSGLEIALLAYNRKPDGNGIEAVNTPDPEYHAPIPPVATACNPRPDIGRTATMTAGGMVVTLTPGTNTNTPSNPITRINFTGFTNGTVKINGQAIAANSTYTVPAGAANVVFTINQVTAGQATTINLNVVDGCGEYPLFFGGGTGSGWPVPTTPPVVPTPTPAPVACNPRPNIGRSASMGPNGLTVTLTKATNANTPTNPMSQIQFTSMVNGTVTVNNQLQTGAFNYAVPVGTDSVTFTIKQVSYGTATTVFMKVIDTCGPYDLFFGGGTSANWPVQTTATPVPVAVTCTPRPNVAVTSAKIGNRTLAVTVTANTNAGSLQNKITQINFNAGNANVIIGGETKTGIFTQQVNATATTFNVTEKVSGQGATANMVVVDGCGNWNTLAGGGPAVFAFADPLIEYSKIAWDSLKNAVGSVYEAVGEVIYDIRNPIISPAYALTMPTLTGTSICDANGGKRVALSWNSNLNPDILNWNIYRQPDFVGFPNAFVGNYTSPFSTPKVTRIDAPLLAQGDAGGTYTYWLENAPGEISNKVTVTNNATCAFNATVVESVVPSQVAPGAQFNVKYTFRNSGTSIWPPVSMVSNNGTALKMVSTTPFTPNSKDMGSSNNTIDISIYPNATYTFEFPVTAPTTVGSYEFNWQLNSSKKAGFFDPVVNTPFGPVVNKTIQVSAPATAAPTPTQVPATVAPTPTTAPSPTTPPVTASPTPGPQCLQGNFSEAIIQEGQNCGIIEAKPASGAATGIIKFKAPNVTQSEAICTIKVTTNNAGGCTLSLPNGKGTAASPLSPGETIDINFGNSCSVNPLSDPALGSYTSNSGGCLVPVRISPEQALPVESEYTYKISETEAGLASAPEVTYEGTEVSMLANYTLLDQNPGLKQFWVEFSNNLTGEKVKDFINVELLSPDPEVIGVNCSSSLGSPNLVVDIYGKNLGANTGSASISVNNKPITKSTWENEYAKGVWNNPEPAVADGSQYQVEVTLSDGRKLAPVSCGVGLSMVSLGTRLFCRGDGSFAVKGVKVLIVDEEGTKIEEMVDISHQGMITGIKSKFSEGKNYIISIKGANLIRRNITFKAQTGTTVIATANGTAVVLPLGDIAPRPDGDGAINGIDQSLLKSQWRVIGDATQPLTGDFNVDKRVNSFDWACMRHDWNARDDEIPAKAPRSTGGTNTPVGSPSACPSAPICPAGQTSVHGDPQGGGCPAYVCLPTPSSSAGVASCTSNAQCGAGNTCFNFQNYPGTCKPADTVCTAAITRACNNANPTECVDFPSSCHVPPGWSIAPRSTPAPSTTVACNPRPNIGRTATMTAQGLQVTLTQATNTNTPTNPMSKINFTKFDNGTVTIGNASPKTAAFTQDIAAGSTAQTFLIKQVTKGQPTTIQLTVVDGCGNYPLFFGGGTSAGWPQ